MPKTKTDFYLEPAASKYRAARIFIVGQRPVSRPYISVRLPEGKEVGYLRGKDLENFAVNILKALKSKHLKSPPKKP